MQTLNANLLKSYQGLQSYADDNAEVCTHEDLSPKGDPDRCLVLRDKDEFVFVFVDAEANPGRKVYFVWVGQHGEGSIEYLRKLPIVNPVKLNVDDTKNLYHQVEYLIQNRGYRLKFGASLNNPETGFN